MIRKGRILEQHSMTRTNLLSRIQEVQDYIATSPRTQTEIARYFGVDRQTAKRAVDRLSEYTNLSETKDGRNMIYRIENPAPLEFTSLELATLIISQGAITSNSSRELGSPFTDSANSLLEKVRERVPPLLRKRLDAFAEVYGSAITPAKDFGGHFGTIEVLVKAAVECKAVILEYESLSDGKVKHRRVEPYNVYFDPDGATLKMIGFDDLRKSIIPFSIDHIKNVTVLAEIFTRPKDHDLKTFLRENCFNGIHGHPITVRLRLTGITACVFAERIFHPSQRVVDRKLSKNGGSLTIEMTVAGGRGLERFIQSWLPEIEVVSPTELRETIRANLKSSLSDLSL